MDIIEKLNKERLKRTEETLKLAGCLKCNSCGVWVDNSFIIAGKCNECIDTKQRGIYGYI